MIALERHTDADAINRVLNHPVVRPWVADMGEGALDISAAVANPRNVLLMGAHGGCLFFNLGGGVYEVHTQVLPEGRGEWTKAMTAAMAFWMFTRTDAWEIVTRVPASHVGAYAAARGVGMRPEFVRPKECLFRGKQEDVHILSFRLQDWAADAPTISAGQWFHRRLHAEAARLGITDQPHADDENHNRYVGIAYEMARRGQLRKAIGWYNRWALVARHPTISLVAETPPTIRMDIGLLRLTPADDIEVLTC